MILPQDGNNCSRRVAPTLPQENKVFGALKTSNSIHDILPSAPMPQYNYMQYIQRSISHLQNIHVKKASHNNTRVKSWGTGAETTYYVYCYCFSCPRPAPACPKKKLSRLADSEKQLCKPWGRGRRY